MFSRKILGLLAILAGLIAGPASATTIYTIGIPNAALAPYAGPYATVSVTRTDATHASIVFDALPGAGVIFLMGDGGSADLNVNGAYTLSGVSATSLPGFSAPVFLTNTPGNVSSFGVFNLSLNFFDGFTHAADKISFTLENTSGTWADDLDVLTANPLGYFAAVHTFVCQLACSPTAAALVTGFATTGVPPEQRAPEPQTLALVALALLAMSAFGRRRAR